MLLLLLLLSLAAGSYPTGTSRMPLNTSHRRKSHGAEIEGCLRVLIVQVLLLLTLQLGR